MRRNGLLSLIFILVLAVGGVVGTIAADNSPLLGLDLQGGVSVVLEPVGDTNDDAVDQAVRIIRQRVDGLGVAEPEISRQGDAIVVQLPGVNDRDRAIELVGQTAELRFRPVLNVQQTGISVGEETEGEDTEGEAPADPDATTTTGADETTTTAVDDTADEHGAPVGIRAFPAQDDTTTTAPTDTTTAPTEATTTTAPTEGEDPFAGMSQDEILDQLFGPITPAEDDVPSQQVTLPQYDDDGNEVARYTLAPVPGAEDPDDPATPALTGEILSTARAELNQTNGAWTVAVEARGGARGIDRFNQTAGTCFQAAPECPTGQLAIVLDGRVISAPVIQAPNFDADGISISGDFSEREAKDLALALRYGALPVELEQQQVQSVSASLGQDALDAGVTAGIIGLGLVFVYMIVYYRLLGVVAMLSLGVSGALLWSVISYLGASQGLALTLAGVTGIIVSIGVAVDSNVVFYEHLKEDVSRGRSLRTAVDGSFRSAFSTIVKADVASLIGAGVLYWLTVGPVRGFALYLGLSTLLDLVASYFFMRPLTLLLVKSGRLQDKPRVFGMPRVATAVVATGEGAPA